jgi:TonB family protein
MPDLPQIQILVNALGWTLIHFLWQGICIAGAFWVVCKVTRPEQASVRYWAGMLAFLSAVVVPVVTFLRSLPGMAEAVPVALTGPGPTLAAAVRPSFGQILQLGLEPAIPVVVALWGMGVTLLSVRAVLGWLGARRLADQDTRPVGEALQAVVEALMRRLGVDQAVRVLSSTRVKVPTVVGWIKPVILLPVSVISRLPQDQLEMIIAHELGHIRRQDYLLNLLQVVVETLFFYHPAIRWMSRQVRQEREHCCDDLVVARCQKPVLYARALANLENLRGPVAAVMMAASGGDLVYRVRRIIRRELPGNHGGFTQLAVLLAVAAVVGLGAHQGLELSRQAIDIIESRAQVTEVGQPSDALERSAWINGVQAYAGLLLTEKENLKDRAEPEGVEKSAPEILNVKRVEVAADPQQGKAAPVAATKLPDRQAVEQVSTPATAKQNRLAREPLPEHALAARTTLGGVLDSDPGHRARSERQSAIGDPSITPETVVAPVYPFKARRKKLEGHVRLEFSVDASGRARDISVVDSSPPDIFDDSAIRALEKWVFDVEDDQGDPPRVYQVFDFNMEDDGPLLSKRERRCDITGSRICGLQRYNK